MPRTLERVFGGTLDMLWSRSAQEHAEYLHLDARDLPAAEPSFSLPDALMRRWDLVGAVEYPGLLLEVNRREAGLIACLLISLSLRFMPNGCCLSIGAVEGRWRLLLPVRKTGELSAELRVSLASVDLGITGSDAIGPTSARHRAPPWVEFGIGKPEGTEHPDITTEPSGRVAYGLGCPLAAASVAVTLLSASREAGQGEQVEFGPYPPSYPIAPGGAAFTIGIARD